MADQIIWASKKRNIVLACSGMLLLVAAVFFIQLFPRDRSYVSFSNLPDDISITATYEQSGKSHPLTPSQNRWHFDMPENLSADRPYNMSFTVRSDDVYRDLILYMDQAQQTFTLTGSGFQPGGEFSVTYNSDVITDGIHWDWAGRLQVELPLKKNADGTLCLYADSDLIFCHTLPERRKA